MHMVVGHLRDSNGQVTDEERQEDGQHHLGDPPFVTPGLRLPIILDGRPLVRAVVESPRARVLGSLMLPHSLL